MEERCERHFMDKVVNSNNMPDDFVNNFGLLGQVLFRKRNERREQERLDKELERELVNKIAGWSQAGRRDRRGKLRRCRRPIKAAGDGWRGAAHGRIWPR